MHALGEAGLFSLVALCTGATLFGWREISLIKLLSAFMLGEILLSLLFLTQLTLAGLKPERSAFLLVTCALPGVLRLGSSLRIYLMPHQQPVLAASSASLFASPIFLSASSALLRFLSVSLFVAVLGLVFTRLGYDVAAYSFAHALLMAVTGKAVSPTQAMFSWSIRFTQGFFLPPPFNFSATRPHGCFHG